jgi:hypothetical protein
MDIASFLSQNEVMLDVGTSDKTKLLPRRIIGGTRVDGKTSSVTDRRFGLRREQRFSRSEHELVARQYPQLGEEADYANSEQSPGFACQRCDETVEPRRLVIRRLEASLSNRFGRCVRDAEHVA